MRHLKRLSLFFIFLLSVVAVYAGGIRTAKDLAAFAKAVNKGEDISAWRNDQGAICLEGDIDMKKMKKWTPIKEFKGTFDGKGYALLNWKTKQSLFDLIAEGGVVKNLRIDASCVMTVAPAEQVIAGFIARVNKGIIQKCENSGSIHYNGTYTEQNIYIGGLVGQNGYVIRDCKNNGVIQGESRIASANKKLNIRIGGIAGSTIPKGSRIITINRCENTAAILFKGDIPHIYVGGIIGFSGRGGVRNCVNRGNITASSIAGNPETKSNYCNVAGVVGQTGQHVQCSDNFGAIKVNGTHTSYAAGVCGGLNAARNIIGCNNYGTVTSTCSVTSAAAGILGVSGDGARLCNCNNYGDVLLKATSIKKGSFVGGIGGYIFSKKSVQCGSRMLRCNNFGKIASDVSNKNLYIGGIAGRTRGSEQGTIMITDCANKGVIDASECSVGEIAARPTYTTVEGEYFHNNMAQAVESVKGDKNIFGYVKSTSGEPVVGAVVSDGEFSVQTNAEGYYEIKSNLARARFVTLSTPSEYKLPFRKSVPQNFLRIPRHAKAVQADFVLEKREKSTEKYTVAMIGDPQIKGVKVDSARYKLKNVIYPDIVTLKKAKAENEDDFFAINLGDLVFNDMAKLDDYVDVISESEIPMFHAIGNHDHDQTTYYETRLGTMHFEEYLTPTYYSFNIGNVHYVIVNSISFARKTTKERYKCGLEYSEYKWLERDLKFVPKDRTIVICGHAQLFRQFGSKKREKDSKTNLSYARYSKLLSQYARVYSWSGHYHYNFGYDYANSTNEAHKSLKNITSICVARATGGLHCNRDLYNDGTPNGYMVMEVDGDKFEWYYKSIGHDRDYQMRIYDPTRTGGELVKVNIWNWSKDHWSEPEWWENGVKVGNMTHKFEKDIAFVEDHKEKGPHYLGKDTKSDKARPYNAHGMFHIKPSAGVRSGEVRVTDNFGKTYIQKVEW